MKALLLLALSAWGRAGGGCFLPETPILMADGRQLALGDVRPGDRVRAFRPDGTLTDAAVLEVHALERDHYVELRGPGFLVRATDEHPFFVGPGFETVSKLAAGARLNAHAPEGLLERPLVSKRRVNGPVRVMNLTVDGPNTYFAGGLAVHNKGGGGGGGGGGSRSSSRRRRTGPRTKADDFADLVMIGVYGVVLLIGALGRRGGQGTRLDLLLPRPAARAASARQEMERLGWDTAGLLDSGGALFLKMQQCWGERDYAPMQPLMASALWKEHVSQLESLKRSHELNKLADLRVDWLEPVHVSQTARGGKQAILMIQATGQDVTLDDRTGAQVRGDAAARPFQEFLTFHHEDGAWKLRAITQTTEASALTMPFFSDDGRPKEGTSAPPPEGGKFGPEVLELQEAARAAFLAVHMAREAGEAAGAREFLADGPYAELEAEVRGRRENGAAIEHRNLCIRGVEIVLERRGEFSARLSAHAQKVVTREGRPHYQDPDVRPFEQLWHFQRRGGSWAAARIEDNSWAPTFA